MDIGEIVRSYRGAKDPEHQIGILSELTLKSIPEIREILIKQGVYNEMKIEWTKEKDAVLLNMKEEGKSYKEIADKLKGTQAAVQSRYHKIKAKPTEVVTKSEPVVKPEPAITDTALKNELYEKNYTLSALVELLRITHEDASTGDEKAYYKTASKYEVLIPLLEDLLGEYDKLTQ